MRLSFVALSGFRGYRKPVRIDFGEQFTIIDGRNGAGKSTIFDAVEFALTGTLAKYGEAKLAGESVTDSCWWTVEGPPPRERYVEVGFCDGPQMLTVRRTQLDKPSADDLERFSASYAS